MANLEAKNVFLDVEAAVDDSEDDLEDDVEGVESELDDLNEEEEAAVAQCTHLHLATAIEEDEQAWEAMLDRARTRGQRPLDGGDEQQEEGSRTLWEIGCKPGLEEAAAYKILKLATHPTMPHVLARSVIARTSLMGRVYAEVDSQEAARTLCARIPELNASILRPIPYHEAPQVLHIHNVAHAEPGRWARVDAQANKWRSYRGDTGHTALAGTKIILLLVPRLTEPDDVGRPPQRLRPYKDMLERFSARRVKKVNENQFKYKRQLFNCEGFLVTDLETTRVLPHSDDILPSLDELDAFEKSTLVDSSLIKHARKEAHLRAIQAGDNVRIISGEFRGLLGKVQGLIGTEADVHIPTYDLVHRMPVAQVRCHYVIGDEVRVTRGEHTGTVGWITQLGGHGLTVVDVDQRREVQCSLGQVERFDRPVKATLRVLRQRGNERIKDPNAVYIDKKIVVVGSETSKGATANLYKGYKGIIKDANVLGLARVELEARNQQIVQLPLDCLVLRSRDDGMGEHRTRLVNLQHQDDRSHTAPRAPATKETDASIKISAPGTPCPATSSSSRTPMPLSTPSATPLSPAWDPASCTLTRLTHWLDQESVVGKRLKLLEDAGKVLEFIAVEGDNARVRDGMQQRLVALGSLKPLHPSAVGDLVVVVSGSLQGNIYKVKEYSGATCNVQEPGTRVSKKKGNHTIVTENLVQVFPPFK
ncbi:hypothetical protein NLJ89_g4845 [Agrocybe chaxingu]|uniref:Chromatin elongation factor SPT5 n=1 Tax=Agrocybe chaxingu TaxID=84603 RepID=A0A9W8K956_9AGAR|nr:hypothetical protein NLJ89_g4845 [Agrocybe chaxingu]